MITVLLIFQVIVALALIGIVLTQRSDADGTGLGGSGGGMGLMSSRAKGSAMTRATAILAALFMLNSLALDLLTAHAGSITDRIHAASDRNHVQAGKALSDEPTTTTTPLSATKTIDGKPGISERSPTGAPTSTATPTQAGDRSAPQPGTNETPAATPATPAPPAPLAAPVAR